MHAVAGTLTPTRGSLWGGLALLLFLVLVPPQVTAGEGWLAVRTPWRLRQVRTDRLASVYTTGIADQRLVLLDVQGGRAELDLRVLVANPRLWYRLEGDAQQSEHCGVLRNGSVALREVAERIDRETASAIFKFSGLEEDQAH